MSNKHKYSHSKKDNVQPSEGIVNVEREPVTIQKSEVPTWGRSISELAQEVIDGKHGSGVEVKESLGDAYEAVQEMVDSILKRPKVIVPEVKVNETKEDTINRLADEVIRGVHGSGRERMLSLGANYTKVQQEVNRRTR